MNMLYGKRERAARVRRTRRIVALWMPRFATERLRRTKDLAVDRPLGLLVQQRGRQILAAVDAGAGGAEALHAGLSLSDARALEPELQTVDWQPEQDRRALNKLAEWCVRYTPLVAYDKRSSCFANGLGGDAGLWLDISGCAHLFGGEQALLEDLINRLSGLGYSARAAVADTAGAAWAAVRFAKCSQAVQILNAGEQLEALSRLPIAALRLAEGDVEALERSGIRTVAALSQLPRAPLAARFGKAVSRRLDQALGHSDEPIEPLATPSPHRVRLGLPEPVASQGDLEAAMRRLLARMVERLERERAGIRRARFDFYRADGGVRSLTLGVGRPVLEVERMMRLAIPHLERLDPGFGIDVIILEVEQVESRYARQSGLMSELVPEVGDEPEIREGAGPEEAGPNGTDNEQVQELLDTFSNRLGEARVYRLQAVESHIPERAETKVGVDAERKPVKADLSHTSFPTGHRPQRLFSRAEPVEVTALLPDYPPARLHWRGVDYRVQKASGPERIAPEWWRAPREGDEDTLSSEGARTRDYFRVEEADGRRFWLYREGMSEHGEAPRWYLQGLL